MLTGRTHELERLRRRLSDASAGHGGLVLLSGEAGIGKSTLAAAIVADAQARGFRVETGRAWEHGEAPPWFPVRGLLRALSIDPSALPTSEAEVFSLWEQVLEGLVALTARAPVLWVLEDLHAADAQTLGLLRYLAQPARMLPLMIVATHRTGAATPEGLVRIEREAERFVLPPLTADEVRALVADVSGRTLDATEVHAWVDRTGGNPLFVVECARARRSDGVLPRTVVQTVLERVRLLPSMTQALLEAASIVGRQTSASMLGRMAGRMPAVVIDNLLPALRSELLEELEPGRFRFSHDVVREAIAAAIDPSRRRTLHRDAELALALAAETVDVLVERAGHALEAAGVIAEARAESVVAQAIALLESKHAYDRAYALWRRARGVDGRPTTAATLIEGTRLALDAGMYADATAHARAAMALASGVQDDLQFAAAALALGRDLRPSVVDRELVQALEAALLGVGSTSEALACRLSARLAAALHPAPEPARTLALARGAVAQARRLGDRTVLREVLFFAGSALIDGVDVVETLPVASELLELSLEDGDDDKALRAYVRRALDHLQLGDVDGFSVDVDRMLALARSVGHPRLVWRALMMGSMRALARGQFEESERLVMEVEQLAKLTDDPSLGLALAAHGAHRWMTMGRAAETEASRRSLEPFLDRSPVPEMAALVRATFAVRQNNATRAAEQLPVLLGARALVCASDFAGVLGEACALAGTDEARARVLSELRGRAGRQVHTGHIPLSYEGRSIASWGCWRRRWASTRRRSRRSSARSRSVTTQALRRGLRGSSWSAGWSRSTRVALPMGRCRSVRPRSALSASA